MVFPEKQLFIRVKQKYLKNHTTVEADPGPLPTAKIELFVTTVCGTKPYIIELSQRVPSKMLVGVPGVSFDYNGILQNSKIA